MKIYLVSDHRHQSVEVLFSFHLTQFSIIHEKASDAQSFTIQLNTLSLFSSHARLVSTFYRFFDSQILSVTPRNEMLSPLLTKPSLRLPT